MLGVVVVPKTPTGDSGWRLSAMGSRCPVNRVWPVVRDYQHFHKFMPQLRKVRLRDRKGNAMKCYFKLDMPFPFSGTVSGEYHFKETAGGGFIRHWSLIRDILEKRQELGCHPWGADQTKTLLVYVDVNCTAEGGNNAKSQWILMCLLSGWRAPASMKMLALTGRWYISISG